MNPEANIEVYKVLRAWNPIDVDDIDAEIYDIMDTLWQGVSDDELSECIANVFLFSFDERVNDSKIATVVTEMRAIQKMYHA